MKVTFQGSPAQVISDMREYLARLSLEEVEVTKPTTEVKQKFTMPQPPAIKIVEVPAGEKPLPIGETNEIPCAFCGLKFEYINKHLRFCKSRPANIVERV